MHLAAMGDGWQIVPSTFEARDVLNITGLPQSLLRLWRKRGYLPEKERGRWAKHDTKEIMDAYLLFALSRLGVAPSDARPLLERLSNDLLFFAVTSGDGACEFVGQSSEVEKLRHQFDDAMDIARSIVKPVDERRFLLSTGGASFSRVGDLAELVESERNEYFFCIDLIAAGRGIVERAKKPLLSFIYGGDQQTSAQVRRLSHGQGFD
ncbi:hypothetical protein Q4525_14030 [Shimia thalassica]|uniref:hypothetical protein n=1 Tax=Shimia thalassica TaxID=1715693 RepID=UPI001C086CBF|nr:hypothetical protein [Shimia thalassica]MBU2941564.1 hypothetical protein [Shimia thalassica]MDO6504055.1 hypothetical protein [Shimia thalassica]